MSPEDAAQKWIDANPDKVNAWLKLRLDARRHGVAAVPAHACLDSPGVRGVMLGAGFTLRNTLRNTQH